MPAKEVRKRLFWLGIKGGLTSRWSRPPFGRRLSSVPLYGLGGLLSFIAARAARETGET